MIQLEDYEWCNYWWDQTDAKNKPRILLVGDSITNGYHQFVKETLGDKVCIDMVVTSKAIDNPAFKREIDYILHHDERFTYEVVHLNSGLHGWHMSEDAYEEHLDHLVGELISGAKGVKVILALSTSVAKDDELTVVNEELNKRVIKRNDAVQRVAKKYELRVDDLYTHSIEHIAYHTDRYHYQEQGRREQGAIVAELLIEELGL